MSFVIEKNIPIPTTDGRTKSGLAAVLRAMEVGDSILVPPENAVSARRMAYVANKKTDKRFVSRPMDGRALRIWRVD